ncbi:hypothetical protein QBC40DRAFT_161179, partial [Triangularia verruculosa]
PDDVLRQLAVIFPPRTHRVSFTKGVNTTELASSQWLQKQTPGFLYMHNLKPQAPAARALLVWSRAEGVPIVNKNIHTIFIRDWFWQDQYRRWSIAVEEVKELGSAPCRDYMGRMPPEITFARLDDPTVKERLPDERVYPELYAWGISNGQAGVKRDEDGLFVQADEIALYFKHYNGYNIRSLLAFSTQGPLARQLHIDEIFIWHVMEQLSSAIIYMQTGITREELKEGVTAKKEAWRPFAHRNINPEHIYIHFEEESERGQLPFTEQETYPSQEEQDEQTENLLNLSLRSVFPRIVLGSWSQANHLNDKKRFYKCNRGERSEALRKWERGDDSDALDDPWAGPKPELWEDIYLLGALLRRLVTVWDAQFASTWKKGKWIDYEIDLERYKVKGARGDREGGPEYSSELLDLLEHFELNNDDIEKGGACWAQDQFYDRPDGRQFPDVDFLIKNVFPAARKKVQDEKERIRRLAGFGTGEVPRPNMEQLLKRDRTTTDVWRYLTERVELIPYTPESATEKRGVPEIKGELRAIHGTKYIIWYQFSGCEIQRPERKLVDWLGVPWTRQAMISPAKLAKGFWHKRYDKWDQQLDTPPGGTPRGGNTPPDGSFLDRDGDPLLVRRRRLLDKNAFTPDRGNVFAGANIESDDDPDVGHSARRKGRVEEWADISELHPQDPFLELDFKTHLKRVLRWMRRAKRVLWHLYPVALPGDDNLDPENVEEHLARDYLKIVRDQVKRRANGGEVTETDEDRAIKQKYHALIERLDPKGEYKVGTDHVFEKHVKQPVQPDPGTVPSPGTDIYGATPEPPSPYKIAQESEEVRKTDLAIRDAQSKLLISHMDRLVSELPKMKRRAATLKTDKRDSRDYQKYLAAKEKHETEEDRLVKYQQIVASLKQDEENQQQWERLQNEHRSKIELFTQTHEESKTQSKLQDQRAKEIAEKLVEAEYSKKMAEDRSTADAEKQKHIERHNSLQNEIIPLRKEMTEIMKRRAALVERKQLLKVRVERIEGLLPQIMTLVRTGGGADASAFKRGYQDGLGNRNQGNDLAPPPPPPPPPPGPRPGPGPGDHDGPSDRHDSIEDDEDDDDDDDNPTEETTAETPEPTTLRRSGRVRKPVARYTAAAYRTTRNPGFTPTQQAEHLRQTQPSSSTTQPSTQPSQDTTPPTKTPKRPPRTPPN